MPPLEPPVEAEANHSPQSLAVPGEQLGQSPLVAPFEAEQQVVVALVCSDRSWWPHFRLSERRLRLSTGSRIFFEVSFAGIPRPAHPCPCHSREKTGPASG